MGFIWPKRFFLSKLCLGPIMEYREGTDLRPMVVRAMVARSREINREITELCPANIWQTDGRLTSNIVAARFDVTYAVRVMPNMKQSYTHRHYSFSSLKISGRQKLERRFF